MLLWIVSADLLPEIATTSVTSDKLFYITSFVAGLMLFWAVAQMA